LDENSAASTEVDEVLWALFGDPIAVITSFHRKTNCRNSSDRCTTRRRNGGLLSIPRSAESWGEDDAPEHSVRRKAVDECRQIGPADGAHPGDEVAGTITAVVCIDAASSKENLDNPSSCVSVTNNRQLHNNKGAAMATSVTTADNNTGCRAAATAARTSGAVEPKVIEVPGPDGAVTTIRQHPDGTIDIHTAAMAASGNAVRVPAAGAATVFATDRARR
jgi:hypothetical protein